MTVFIIERQLDKAGWFALAGAILTFFGFIHGEEIGFAQSPAVAIGYLAVAAMLFGFARYAEVAPAQSSLMHGEGETAAQPAE